MMSFELPPFSHDSEEWELPAFSFGSGHGNYSQTSMPDAKLSRLPLRTGGNVLRGGRMIVHCLRIEFAVPEARDAVRMMQTYLDDTSSIVKSPAIRARGRIVLTRFEKSERGLRQAPGD